MEHYEKKISFLGENIQTIRKHRGMKQQELGGQNRYQYAEPFQD